MSADEPTTKKMRDFSKMVEEKIPEYIEPAKKDKTALPVALENLLALEKKTRLAADLDSTKKLAVAIIKLCRECEAWQSLSDHIQLLCKRRAQLSKVMQAVIQTAYEFVVETPDLETKIKLIDTLRTVSAGKIFVELERARLTRTLAEIREAEGDLTTAADIAQEVSVETVGAMEVREKTEFLLYQIKLCMLVKDFVRTELISNKIKPANLDKDDFQDLKVRYYDLMIEFHTKKKQNLECSKCYESYFRTKSIQEVESKWQMALARSVFFAALSPWDHDVQELVIRLKNEKLIAKLPSFKAVLEFLTTRELIDYPLPKQGPEWKTLLSDLLEGEDGQAREKELHTRIIQHNIRVISGFYTRITSARLAELLHLDADTTERCLSEMVSDKQLYAKIDRCDAKISFQKKQTANQVLTEWSGDIVQLLGLVEKTCHLINKENMLHGIKA